MIQTKLRASDSEQWSQEPEVAPVRTSRLGKIVADRYRVVARLGAGGMGEVYEVEHLLLGRRFAIKFLRADSSRDPRIVARFTREARAMALVESEHVVSILDFGAHSDGTPFLIMELLRGEDLRQFLARFGSLPVTRAIGILLDACAGLRVMHRAGLVHRDLKPANLFVTVRDNGEDLCKVLDFGVVKSVVTDSTHHGSLIGTLRYMAPEQLREGGEVGPRTDIYALGSILYECLVGHAPHEGDTIERVIFKIMNDRPRPLDALRHGFPAGLSAVVARALARDARSRFASVEDFAEALSQFGDTRRKARGVAANVSNKITCPDVSLFTERRRARFRLAWRLSLGALILIGAFIAGFARHAARRVAPTGTTTFGRTFGGTVSSAGAASPAALAATTPLPTTLASTHPEAPASGSAGTLKPLGRTQRAARAPGLSTARSAPTPNPLLPSIDPRNPYGK